MSNEPGAQGAYGAHGAQEAQGANRAGGPGGSSGPRVTGQAGDGMGPLGPGHAPAKDPMKGIRGIMAGTLIMETISFLLVLTVIGRVNEGEAWTPGNLTFVLLLCLAFLVMAFLQKRRWADPVNIGLQVIALAGFVVHPSMGAMAVVYALVWWYIYHLRSNLKERMKRGLLTTQHT